MGDSKARQMEQYTLEASKDTPLTTYFGTQAAVSYNGSIWALVYFKCNTRDHRDYPTARGVY